MSRRSSVRAFITIAILAAVTFPIIGCGGGSNGGKAGTNKDTDLAVTFFDHRGRTDVYRNQQLEFRFTVAVKPKTVTSRTLRIMKGPNLSTPVEGALKVDGNRVFFDPTLTQNSWDKLGVSAKPDLPFGMEALVNHQVYIPGPGTAKRIQNRSGQPIVQEYVSNFQTSDYYKPELNPPEFIGIDGTGELGFFPPRNDDGSVPFDAQIILQFDEAMSPGSMNPGVTILVKNEDVLDFTGRPIDVPGTFKPSRDGTTYSFVPSFHYGTGPYRISVTLTQEVRDLAGNPLLNPRTIYFTTEFNPDVDTVSTLSENFNNNTYEDRVNTNAEWNRQIEGALVGGAITTTTVTVHYVGDNIASRNVLVDYPLTSQDGNAVCPSWPDGNRTQLSYSADDIGASGAVTEVFWGPSSNALFAASHENMKIRLGHTSDTAGVLTNKFEENFKDGMPNPHYDGPYYIPQDANVNAAPGINTTVSDHWAFPTLTTPFDYNGTNGFFLDFQMDSANDCQIMRAWFFGIPGSPQNPGNRNVVAKDKSAQTDNFTGGGQPLVYDIALKLRRRLTNAQSKFYDSAQGQPNWADPIVSPPSQAGGASYTIEWQGAHGMPDPKFSWRVIPDPLTYTPWSGSVDIADNHRFVRFRILLIANLNSDTVPRFDKIQMPYSFRPK